MINDDRRLVQQCLNGEPRAFDGLFDRHAARVFNLLRRLSGDAQLAEDLAQETFVAAFRSVADWRGRGAFSSWLCGIACKLYANHRRRPSLQLDCLDEEEEIPDWAADPLERCTQAESIARMEAAIRGLPEACREVFVLVRMEGFGYREAAEWLEIPLGTVQSRLARAVRLLQKAVSSEASFSEQERGPEDAVDGAYAGEPIRSAL